MVDWWILRSVYKSKKSLRRQSLYRKRFPNIRFNKQKLNTRSSTESEIIGMDDFIPVNIWTGNFFKSQFYRVTENILFQDNRSALLLENIGKASSVKRKKHINLCYFFVTYRIQKGDISVEWCPTNNMTGDFSTKTNQGYLLRRSREMIMGIVVQPGPGLVIPNNNHWWAH